jgi:hypothetical protein
MFHRCWEGPTETHTQHQLRGVGAETTEAMAWGGWPRGKPGGKPGFLLGKPMGNPKFSEEKLPKDRRLSFWRPTTWCM